MKKSFEETVAHRRSVRIFKDVAIDTEVVRKCIHSATLAPNSSNMQLWEFYHITQPQPLKEMAVACLGQNAASYAKQMVVVVVRKDLWRNRAAANLGFLKNSFGAKRAEDYSKREKFALNYYQKLIPTIYFDFLGIAGWIKYLIFWVIGLFKPVYRQVRLSDMRVVAHKSAALASENFMLAMSANDYDTCPMEGFDSYRVKKNLKLPRKAEINMVIACGIRDEKGIYGPRFRIPFEEVYFQL